MTEEGGERGKWGAGGQFLSDLRVLVYEWSLSKILCKQLYLGSALKN